MMSNEHLSYDIGVDVCGVGPSFSPNNSNEEQNWPKVTKDSERGFIKLTHKDGRVEEFIRAKVFRGPVHQNFACPTARRETFEGWPEKAAISPEKLVEAGFFYLGQKDSVRCFYCDLGLQEWNTEDDAWVEHAKHQPECFFVNLVKGEDFIQRVTSQLNELKISENQSSSSNQTLELPENEQVSSIQPESLESITEVLSETGTSNQSPTDIPTSGQEVIKNSRSLTPSPTLSSCSSRQSRSSPKSSVSSESPSLNPTCLICLEREVKVFFYPCGHAVTCLECSSAVTHCIACRKRITTMLKIHYL